MTETHKSPDEILQLIEKEEKKAKYGQLKIFFGYAAGVGKTYAMLKAAHREKDQGTDVVAGYIEPHARPQTTKLLAGLEQLPPRIVIHGDISLKEFDIDRALMRKPQLILVDELAHTNADECRHKKRYKDIEELLKAGINVYTTVNVQHIESLNDIVASITGIIVQERIPDFVFDNADQVELVDIEPDDLIKRLNEGAIYKTVRVQTALKNFFTVENLIALRELALRRTADRVNKISQKARSESKGEYYTDEHVLVCLSSSPSNPRIIRTAARLSRAFNGKFTALFVRTGDFGNYSAANKLRLRENTRLAEQMGAGIEMVTGDDIAYQIAEFAKYAGVSKIVIGRSTTKSKIGFIRQGFLDKLINLASNLDIYVIPDKATPIYKKKMKSIFSRGVNKADLYKIVVMWLVTTLIAFLFSIINLGQADIATIYILSVLITGVITSDRFYSILLSFFNVLTFDYLFVSPKYTFSYSDYKYTGTFLIMFIAAFITASLASKIKRQSEQSVQTAYRTKILLDTNQLLQKAKDINEIAQITAGQLLKLIGRTIIYYGCNEDKLLAPVIRASDKDKDLNTYISVNEKAVAQWVFKNNKHAGASTNTLGSAKCLYMAIRTEDRVHGVIGIALADSRLDPFESSIVLSILGECSLAMEKELYNQKRRQAAVQVQNEKLRSNFLRSISHDLRTPLTSISGNADFLLNNGENIGADKRKKIYTAVYDDAKWLINLVENILSITRIENGNMKINRQVELINDVINEAVSHIADSQKAGHVIKFIEPANMYFSKFDAKLIMQVVINIIDNALKYTPDGSIIEIKVKKQGKYIAISIADDGDGIADDKKEKVFDMFYTGDNKSADSRRGMGIGLALCKSIIEAHGGTIEIKDNKPKGTIFVFTLLVEEVNINE
ncbi:sensor histidine kinase [Pectinatus sottacetonis]|uniref:sensor histidine kinase n=1 Tax=Pectinatus sottacetonis TaxID=1002795 RepID=UPI0018C4513C|nr:sensor histidine kinase KdpD [Pectinatus sottacetonis]